MTRAKASPQSLIAAGGRDTHNGPGNDYSLMQLSPLYSYWSKSIQTHSLIDSNQCDIEKI